MALLIDVFRKRLWKQMAKVIKHSGFLFILAFLCSAAFTQSLYPVHYTIADSATTKNPPLLQNEFNNKIAAADYVSKLATELKGQGYITVSIDSVQLDSLQGEVHLFLGQQYRWVQIKTAPEDEVLLQALRWNKEQFAEASLDFEHIGIWQERILTYLEENGHPFAKTFLDSIEIDRGAVNALLRIDRGPLYKIDSIRVYGDAKIDNELLQRYLDIKNGSIYSKKKLQAIAGKLASLNYIQEERPSNVTLLGSGSVLNLYLKNRKSSQVNGLIGFLPNADALAKKKLLITGELNVLLR
ncbi:MAG TPA: POTRA domain-containing protein, partial [Chitinophagaceae bacterium]|nr:POTRA domain-containing protein [Chitinophagaceae bacterium]